MVFTAAVVGLGYWGPNLARNLSASVDFQLVGLCDHDPSCLNKTAAMYPAAASHVDFERMLAEVRPDLVAVATPVASHYPLAKAALLAGCHVLVEKPLAMTVADAQDLLALAERQQRHVFVDHTYVFTGAVMELKRQLATGQLGDLLYIDSVRINLGLFQSDVDVIWDLAPHDLAILHEVIGRMPATVQVMGSCHNPHGLVDVAYLHLDYGAGLTAHLHLSWLSPVKMRRMIFAGTRQSLIFDDLEMAEKIKIYDHGVAFEASSDLAARREMLVNYRKGDMRAPAIGTVEALATELAEVAAVLRDNGKSRASGIAGLAVLAILEAADRSMKSGGIPVVPDDVLTPRTG
jgi:predicted dehydrogenase